MTDDPERRLEDCELALIETERERDEAHVQLKRIHGELVDAATVVVDAQHLDRGVHHLRVQRDEARAEATRLIEALHEVLRQLNDWRSSDAAAVARTALAYPALKEWMP